MTQTLLFENQLFQLEYFFFLIIILKYIKPKTIVALHSFCHMCSWNYVDVNNCIHEVILQASIYFDILQYFPPPNVHIIPQPHHQSADPSVQFSVTLLQNMTINTLTSYNNKFPPPILSPVIKCLLTGMKWKLWFIPASSHQSGPSETWKLC